MSTSDENGPVVLADEQESGAAVTAHQCSPDRVVFTEQDNTDGWIATDLTVDLIR